MSDYLSGIGGVDLTPITNTDPQDGEDRAQVGAVIRQLKDILPRFLAVSHNIIDGTLKGSAVANSAIGQGEVAGSADNTVAAIEGTIEAGTISTNDLRDLAVATAKIADAAVTLAKLANMAADAILGRATAGVGGVEVLTTLPWANTGDVTRPADSAVTTIATGAVVTAKLADSAVTNVKIADTTIGPEKLSLTGTAGQLLVATGSTPKWAAVSLSGGATLSAAGVLTLSGGIAVGMAIIRERAAKGTSAGASAGSVDLTALALTGIRGNLTAWQVTGTLAGSISVSADGTITFSTAGTYIFFVRVPVFSGGSHKCALQILDAAAASLVSTTFGSSAYAAPGQQTDSCLETAMVLTAGQKLRLRSYVEVARVVDGFGIATSATGTTEEVYSTISVIKQ